MTWENYGKNDGLGYHRWWQFGHRLPVAIFDGSNRNDLRKCFLPINLYAQDAKENNSLRHKLVYSDKELLALRECWPDAALNSLDRLKRLFDKTDKSSSEPEYDDLDYSSELDDI